MQKTSKEMHEGVVPHQVKPCDDEATPVSNPSTSALAHVEIFSGLLWISKISLPMKIYEEDKIKATESVGCTFHIILSRCWYFPKN